jgi:tetratricopeptide (TPR) repeat protein
MEIDNPVVQLCIAGTQAEFQHHIDEAIEFYEQARQAQTNNYEACIAAHYMARHQKDPKIEFDWNQKALEFTKSCADERVTPFFPSLYLNMGKSYERLGDTKSAQEYYDKAAILGLPHQMEIRE